MKNLVKCVFFSVILGVLFSGAAYATPVGYTDQAAFLAALPGSPNVLDFDSMAPGDLIADGDTVDGITFNYPDLADFGVSMMVTDYYELGTDDGDVFQDGDNFNLTFTSSNAIGMFFIFGDEMLDDDITLAAGGGSVGLDPNIYEDLGDDYYAYFLGIVDDEASFTLAEITTSAMDGGPYFFYTVDDITTSPAAPVPEPATMLLLGSGLLGLVGIRQKIKRF